MDVKRWPQTYDEDTLLTKLLVLWLPAAASMYVPATKQRVLLVRINVSTIRYGNTN